MNGECSWDIVKTKIKDSLLAIENGYIIENSLIEFEQDRAKRPLSLYAVAAAPRFRLFLSAIEELEKEVGTCIVGAIRTLCFDPATLDKFQCSVLSLEHGMFSDWQDITCVWWKGILQIFPSGIHKKVTSDAVLVVSKAQRCIYITIPRSPLMGS